MQSSLAIRIKDPNGEVGCSHTADNDPTFTSFATHFPSFLQFDRWNHLACVYRTTGIDFAYNELYQTHSVALPDTVDPQSANDRFSFGFPKDMPIYFHEARVWRSARSHGEILKYLYR